MWHVLKHPLHPGPPPPLPHNPHTTPWQDEFWTSQRCHTCKSFLVDGPQHREKQCVTCDKVINRDVNAVLNLKVGT